MTRLLLLFFLGLSSLLSAQDQIILMNGEEISGWVLEVGPEIRYRSADFPDGPIYVLIRNEVAMILYENGHEESLSADDYWLSRYGYNIARDKYLRVNGRNRYYEGVTLISRADFEQRLRKYPGVYESFNTGRKLQQASYIVSGGGLLLTFVGIISSVPKRDDFFTTSISSNPSSPTRNGTGIIGLGLGITLGGAILYGVGAQRVSRALDNYNIAVGKDVGMKPVISGNGIGLALSF